MDDRVAQGAGAQVQGPVRMAAALPDFTADNETRALYDTLEDLNGNVYSDNSSGEVQDLLERHIIYVTTGVPVAGRDDRPWNIAQGANQITVNKQQWTKPQLVNTMALNFAYLRSLGSMRDERIKDGPLAEACLYRALALQTNLCSPNFDMAEFHNVHKETFVINDQNVANFAWHTPENLKAAQKACIKWLQTVNDTFRAKTAQFANLVSLVAYGFRTRGHHYVPDMQKMYDDLWKKIGADRPDLEVGWDTIATVSTHAIPPALLDEFWVRLARGGKLHPTLTLRVDAPAAGTAAFRAIKAGWEDVAASLPKMKMAYKDKFEDLQRILQVLDTRRWAHSVNGTLYGETSERLPTAGVQQLAAVVVGAYRKLAADSSLSASESLKREANQSPILISVMEGLAINLKRRAIDDILTQDT